MAETVNIAELAALMSEKIFGAFNWKLADIKDENFPCEKVKRHQTKGAGSKHPVDCVFSYPDPFSSKTVFFLTDLKSYAGGTITTQDFAPYIRQLSKSIECAAISPAWQQRYIATGINDWIIDGMLFVYNHDKEYDKEFKKHARGLAPASLQQPRRSRVHLLDPEDISHLQSVVKDIKSNCGEHGLEYSQRRFFYPHQLINNPGDSRMPVATIEMLRGRMFIVILTEALLKQDRYYVYLKGDGTIDDFEYLVTYLYRHGVMELATSVRIAGTSFSPDAQTHLNTAKQNFLLRHYKMKEIKASLERISFGRVDRVTDSFSTTDAALARAKK